MEGADAVLRSGQVDRGLAADRRVDLANECRRHGRPRDSAHVRRRGEPGDVGGRTAAERHERAVAADPELRPESLEHGGCLGRLSRGYLVLREVARTECDLRPDPVDTRDPRVRDQLDGSVAGDEVAELVDRAELDMDAGRGEQDPVDVARLRVRHRLIEGLPVAMQRVERLLVLRERPTRSHDPLPGGLRVDIEQHRERAPGELCLRALRLHRPAPERDDERVAFAQNVACDGLLDCPEPGLAARDEQLRDGGAGAQLDLAIEIDEPTPEPLRDRLAGVRLPRTHEPGQRQVPAERVQPRGFHRSPIRRR